MALLVDLYNKYNPLCTSPTPIVLQQERFLKKQIWDKNTRKYGYFYAISLTENKLNEKKKVKNKCAEILTEPMCVIWVIYPLGNLTTHRVMEIIMVNKVIEQTM